MPFSGHGSQLGSPGLQNLSPISSKPAPLGFSEVSGIGRSERVGQLLNEGTGRLRRQGVDLNDASQIVAILSGARSFTRSEVRDLNVKLQRMCRPRARVFFGTSMVQMPPDEIHLTLIV